MRFAVACTVALLMAPALVSSTEAEPRDALAVSIYGGEELGVLVHWTPAPNAIAYALFRGETPETAVFMDEVVGTLWRDSAPLEGVSWYVIVSIPMQSGTQPEGPYDLGGFRGSCLHRSGGTGITITASHCLPRDPL